MGGEDETHINATQDEVGRNHISTRKKMQYGPRRIISSNDRTAKCGEVIKERVVDAGQTIGRATHWASP